MKKIINLLLAVCLMVSIFSVSALAEETTYTGPATHSYPTFIDFNEEGITTYDGTGADESQNFYHLNSYSYIAADPEDATNRFLWLRGTAAVQGSVAIKFDDFEYDATAPEGVQPEKLVISFDADYKFAANNNVNYLLNATTLGWNQQHIAFGADEEITANRTNFSNWNTLGRNGLFFNWDYDVDVDNKTVLNPVYGSLYDRKTFESTEMNNLAHIAKINNGDTINYTFVMDLTRDENNKGNVIVYIDGVSSGKLVSDYNGVDGDDEDTKGDGVEKINTFLFTTNKKNSAAIDNVRIYTIDNAAVTATSASVSGTDVPLTTEEVTVNFSHEITTAADKYLVVKKGEEVLIPGTDYTIEHVVSDTGAKTAKALKVKFADTLSYATTYSVGASADYFGVDGYTIGEETTFTSFTTESAPQINLSALSIKKGFFGNIDVTSLADCLGSTVSITTTATNAEADTAIGTVFFGVYKNGVLVNLAMVNKTFAAAETDEITVNIMLPTATASDVIEIKAFACESLGNLDAYGTVQSISTAD